MKKMIPSVIVLFAATLATSAFAASDWEVQQALDQIRIARDELERGAAPARPGAGRLGRGGGLTVAQRLERAENLLDRALLTPNVPPVVVPPVYGPVLVGQTCMSACKTSDGKADMTRIVIAKAGFEAQARHDAGVAVQTKYSCGNGPIDVECSAEYSGYAFFSGAACQTASQTHDLTRVRLGQGATVTEAKYSSLTATQRDFSCGNGSKEFITSDSTTARPTYCTAACKTASGTADMTRTQAVTGASVAEATVKVLIATQNQYSCGNGPMITGCSSN